MAEASAGAPRQLPLEFGHEAARGAEDFIPSASNAAALELISRWPDWPARIVALIGPDGSGKSHLAAVWAAHAGADVMAAQALTEQGVPNALKRNALVLEDGDRGGLDERALFHALNMAREQDAYMLLTARRPPASWQVVIPDLTSRLRAMPTIVIEAPDEALIAAVMVKLFADRQLEARKPVIEFLVRRMDRSLANAARLVAALDALALSERRPITRAVAADVLARLEGRS
jgi:chromosomal replication initiation ATPase DnaA